MLDFEKKLKNEFFWIILLAAIIRVLGLSSALFDDEGSWAFAIAAIRKGNLHYTQLIPHPPLAIMGYSTISTIFGSVSTVTLRLTPLIFGLTTIYITYLIANEIYGRRIALLSSFILAISFYHVWASLQVDVDGSLLTLLITVCIYSYHKFSKTDDNKWLIASGLWFGLAMLAKYSAIWLLLILLLYGVFYSKQDVKSIVFITLIGAAFFSLFPLATVLINKPYIFIETLGHSSKNLLRFGLFSPFSLTFSLLQNIMLLFQYATPLLPLCSVLALYNRKKEENLLFLWVAVYLLFYTFMFKRPIIPRYLMVIIPPMGILTAKVISEIFIEFRKSDMLRVAFVTIPSMAILVGLNTFSNMIVNFNYIGVFKSLIENPPLWYDGVAGPLFLVYGNSFLFVSILSILLFIFLIFAKTFSKNGFKFAMIALISLSLAFNIVILHESMSPVIGPDYSDTVFGLANFYKRNDMPSPLYSINEEIPFYLELMDYYDLETPNTRANIRQFGGTVLFLNVPFRYVEFKEAFEKCEHIKTFYSNSYEAGFVFICKSNTH